MKTLGTGLAAAPLLGPALALADEKTLSLKGRKFEGSLLKTKWEGIETTDPSVQHPYFKDKNWKKDNPDFLASNAVRADNNAKRGEANLKKHDPRLQVSKNKSEATVDFRNDPPHPQAAGHWWSWIEIWDGKGKPAVLRFEEPAAGETLWGEAGNAFVATFFLDGSPLGGERLRVRAYCVTHGLYTKYFNIQ